MDSLPEKQSQVTHANVFLRWYSNIPVISCPCGSSSSEIISIIIISSSRSDSTISQNKEPRAAAGARVLYQWK